MKIIILQNVPYRHPEGTLAQYHGAIWAEELRRRGHDATKMVIGDPSLVSPESPLLSLSTQQQRMEPAFWRKCGADIILSYGGYSETDLQLVRAIKTGSPKTMFVARIEGLAAPAARSVRASLGAFPARYIAARHCPTESFAKEKASAGYAFLRALAQTVRSCITSPCGCFENLADAADAVTFFFPRLVEEAQDFLRQVGRADLSGKVRWAGYPVRPEFVPPTDAKTSRTVVSVANWRHFKDPELTADAMAIVLRKCPKVTYTIIGQHSQRVASRIVEKNPDSSSQVIAREHIENKMLPSIISQSQVFLLCSYREGVPSVLSEALCCGCSLALSKGPAVGAFRDYLALGDGSQARSRHPQDMAEAILSELDAWASNRRNANMIANKWADTHVSSLCETLLSISCAADTRR